MNQILIMKTTIKNQIIGAKEGELKCFFEVIFLRTCVTANVRFSELFNLNGRVLVFSWRSPSPAPCSSSVIDPLSGCLQVGSLQPPILLLILSAGAALLSSVSGSRSSASL